MESDRRKVYVEVNVTKELRRSEFEGLDSYFKNEYNKANEVLQTARFRGH